MTEVTVENDRQREPIRPLAFLVALISAPLVTALPGIAVLFVATYFDADLGPLFIVAMFLFGALFVGGIPYLVVGIPGLIYALHRYGRHARTGRFAFFGHILSIPAIFLIALVVEGDDALGFILFYLVLGSLFAPLWGMLFSIIYNRVIDWGHARHV